MSTIELVLCSLGEATATIYHRNRNSQGFPSLKKDAGDAGATAGKARKVIEEDIGESVVSQDNHLTLITKGKTRGKRRIGNPSKGTQIENTQQPLLFDEEKPEEK